MIEALDQAARPEAAAARAQAQGGRSSTGLSASAIALATSLSAWPAAAYGALVIWAAGSMVARGTLWVFGWPFLGALLTASTLHQLAVGAAQRFGIPALVPGVNAFDHALDRRGGVASHDPAQLRAALRAAERFPLWNIAIGSVLSAMVVAFAAILERFAGGPTAPNTWVIVRGGAYATALYATASLVLGEWLTRGNCRALRSAAAAAGIEPYGSLTVGRAARVAVMVVPTAVALLVAVEVGSSPHAGTAAYGALVLLSAVVVTALGFLQYENERSAILEIRDACRELDAGHEGGLITGSLDPSLLEMAREFTLAAAHVAARNRDFGARHRAVFEAALDGILTIDGDGRILELNPAAERIFGCAQAQLVGREIEALVPAIRTGGSGGPLPALGDAAVVGRRREILARRSDGSEFQAEIALTAMEQGGVKVLTVHLRDITDRKEAEERLQRSQRELAEHGEIAAALLRIGETLNTHLHRSDLLEQVCRLTVDALACDACSIFVLERGRGGRAFALRANVGSLPDVVDEIQQVEFANEFSLIDAIRAGAPVELADATQAPNLLPPQLARRWRIASMLAAPIVRSGEVVGVLAATYRERTGPFSARQRDLAVGVAHTTAVALENAQLIADLQQASRLKTEFVSTMSHEFRTPLNVILGFCDMARDPTLPEDEREVLLERIARAGSTLLELVDGTLEIGKLEAGRDDPHLEPVDLTPLWERLAAEHDGRPRGPDVALQWSPGIPGVVVLADARRLAIVIRNLVGNALKFTERGWVRVAMAIDGDAVVLSVSDSGIGIAEADQEKIFGMFRQADASDSRRHGGTGLGLYLVRRFVEQFGGSVDVSSTPGQGSVFSVRLARARSADAAQPTVA